MFALERLKLITRFIEEHRQAEVHSLSRMLKVSEVTIRRDLEKLESQGVLIRTHGGAVKNEEPELHIPNEPSIHAKEMARTALSMIEDGDTIFLSPGETSVYIASGLKGKTDVTLLTNYLPVALAGVQTAGVKVVVLGGELSPGEPYLSGTLSLGNLRRFHVEKCFIEVDGIDKKLNLYASSQEKAEILETVFDISDKQIVLCKPQNFGQKAFCKVVGLQPPYPCITNIMVPEEFKELLFNHNIQVYTSINVFEGRIP